MSSRRTAKAAQAILETVSTAILSELKDPRVKNVTVTHAEVSGDLRNAKIYVSVMGDDRTQALTMHGLNSARGFLQSRLADRLNTRYTPVLKFILDSSVKQSVATSRLLREILPGETEEAMDDGVSTVPDDDSATRDHSGESFSGEATEPSPDKSPESNSESDAVEIDGARAPDT